MLERWCIATAQCRQVTSWALKVAGAVGLVFGCATTYGPAFSNAGSTQHDVYLYGAHAAASEAEASSTDEESSEEESADIEVASQKAPARPSKDKPSKTVGALEQDGGASDLVASQLTPGTYKGTDWVTIDLPGFPGSEQVDDKARIVLAAVSGSSRLSFTVLDTNSGNELCSVEGAVVNDLIAFDPNQSCFEGILGVPMRTSLYEGEGRMTDGGLEVTLGIELTLTSPDGDEIVGDLSYRFEGKLTAPSSSDD